MEAVSRAGRNRVPMDQRFWERVQKTDTCWLWLGPPGDKGYGQLSTPGGVSGRRILVHRFSAMLHFGMFDRRLMVLHHCDVRLCVNPAHLYLGTAADNWRDTLERSNHPGNGRGKWTHCIRGHLFTSADTRSDGRGKRRCRTCKRELDRLAKASKRRAAREMSAQVVLL
jgi:hypothetical protein